MRLRSRGVDGTWPPGPGAQPQVNRLAFLIRPPAATNAPKRREDQTNPASGCFGHPYFSTSAADGMQVRASLQAKTPMNEDLILLSAEGLCARGPAGPPPPNAVVLKRLSSRDRERLRAALEAVRHLSDLTRDLLFKG